MHDFTDRTQHKTASASPPPTTIYSDNNTAIKWLKNQLHHSQTKHIDTLTLKICEQVMKVNTLKVEPVRTEFQTGVSSAKHSAALRTGDIREYYSDYQIQKPAKTSRSGGWVRQWTLTAQYKKEFVSGEDFCDTGGRGSVRRELCQQNGVFSGRYSGRELLEPCGG